MIIGVTHFLHIREPKSERGSDLFKVTQLVGDVSLDLPDSKGLEREKREEGVELWKQGQIHNDDGAGEGQEEDNGSRGFRWARF